MCYWEELDLVTTQTRLEQKLFRTVTASCSVTGLNLENEQKLEKSGPERRYRL